MSKIETINGVDYVVEEIKTKHKTHLIKTRISTPEDIALSNKEQEIYNLNKWLELRKNISDSVMTTEQVTERQTKQARLLELLG